MKLDQSQLDALAVFCGMTLKQPKIYHPLTWCWTQSYKGNDNYRISYYNWNPLTNPAHTMLLLEALVKARPEDANIRANRWRGTLATLEKMARCQGKDFNFPSAIVSAALEVIEKGE